MIASRLVSKMKPLASASFLAFNAAAPDSAADPFVANKKNPKRENHSARIIGHLGKINRPFESPSTWTEYLSTTRLQSTPRLGILTRRSLRDKAAISIKIGGDFMLDGKLRIAPTCYHVLH